MYGDTFGEEGAAQGSKSSNLTRFYLQIIVHFARIQSNLFSFDSVYGPKIDFSKI